MNNNNNMTKNNMNNKNNTNKKRNNNYNKNNMNSVNINNKSKNNINDSINKNNNNNIKNVTCLMLFHPGQTLLAAGPQLSSLPYRPPHRIQSEREPDLPSFRVLTFRIHGALPPSSKFAFMACLLLNIFILLFKQPGQRYWHSTRLASERPTTRRSILFKGVQTCSGAHPVCLLSGYRSLVLWEFQN
jgi:hypothetical protein